MSDAESLLKYCVESVLHVFKNVKRWKAFLKRFILLVTWLSVRQEPLEKKPRRGQATAWRSSGRLTDLIRRE